MKEHAQKVALVTGASRGIGRAIAVGLSQRGFRVALLARDEKALKETASRCGNESLVVVCDVAHPESWSSGLDQVNQKWGRLDVLVNNAGIHESADWESWKKTIDVNLTALMGLTHLALPHIERAGGGVVINIASVAGIMGSPKSAAYCATKHGVMGFTRALFEDVREKNIKVSAICPGFVATDLTESPRFDSSKMIQPEDVATAVLFVIDFPATGCPTEIVIRPQRSPRK